MTGAPAPYPTAPEAAEAAEVPRKRSRMVDAIIEIVTTVGLAVVLYLIITTFVVQTFRVEQHSMIDTLQPGEHLFIDKLTPRFDEYSRGDIIVFHPNGDADSTPYIKRVIGVGGEKVELRDGAVWIDGVRLDEEYTYLGEPTEPSDFRGQTAWDVPEGSLFVMGDHRQRSKDSRSEDLGFVKTGDVVGRAVVSFFPLDKVGILQTPQYPELSGAQ